MQEQDRARLLAKLEVVKKVRTRIRRSIKKWEGATMQLGTSEKSNSTRKVSVAGAGVWAWGRSRSRSRSMDMGQEHEQEQEYGHGAGKCNICSPNNVVVWEGAICLNQIRPDQKEGEGAEILLENFLSSQINLLIIEGSTFGNKR